MVKKPPFNPFNTASFSLIFLALALLLGGCAADSQQTIEKPVDLSTHAREPVFVSVENGVLTEPEAGLLETQTVNKLDAAGTFPEVSPAPAVIQDKSYLLVKCSPKNVSRVSESLRMMTGAMAGRASVTVEVVIVQMPSGEVLGQAEIGGRSSGGNIFAGTTNDAISMTAGAIANFVTSRSPG